MRQLKIEKSITSRGRCCNERYMKEVAKEEMITAEEEAELAMMIFSATTNTHKSPG